MKISTAFCALSVLAGVLIPGPQASSTEPTTTCTFSGPTPGFRALRLDLPEGSHFLGLEVRGSRSPRMASGDENWHLAQGIAVFDADTGQPMAWRVHSSGSSPRSHVVRVDGETVVDVSATGPDAPLGRSASALRATLPPGTYDVVGFGTDGGRGLPNEWWAADVRVAGTHACSFIGSGEVFDLANGDFEDGTQVSTYGAGYAQDAALEFQTTRQRVFGLLDASVYGPGTAEVAYTTPTDGGEASDELIPLFSTGGDYTFTASYTGAFPLTAVAGVAFDLPAR